MVYLSTSDEWQKQTSLLLQARPTTTRITTKYNIPNLDSPRYQPSKKRKREVEGDDKNAASAGPRVPRATLTLKTYCPESGVTLKFKTDRAAEVGRLIGGLGRMGRHMAALPEKAEAPEVTMEDAPATAQVTGAVKDSGDTKTQPPAGGGKKKKKNKK